MAASSTMEQLPTVNHHLPFEGEDENHSNNSNGIMNNEGSSTFDNYDDFPLDDDDDDGGEYKEDYFDTHYDNNINIKSNIPQQQALRSSVVDGNSSNNSATWVQLLNLPDDQLFNRQSSNQHHHNHGVPVGGMRRVSSCYFSIASNISDGGGGNVGNAFHSPNPSYHNSYYNGSSINSCHHDALSFDGRNASDFLLHDVLMNLFSFLDAQSLASFSETGRRPNFEVFYFLELQLQRALLMGESRNHFFGDVEEGTLLGRVDEDEVVEQQHHGEVEDEHDDDDDRIVVAEGMRGGEDANNGLRLAQDEPMNDGAGGDIAQDWDVPNDDSGSTNIDHNCNDRDNAIPSFEGSIAGTGVITRLSSLDNAMARKIVQTYLDSNTSIHAMPLSHSLAYFRQVLLRQHLSMSSPFSKYPRPAVAEATVNNVPNNTDTIAKNARNMAIFFTFLGAAYMHAQGDVSNMPIPPMSMPDPSDVLNEENVEAFKNMMLKVGLAGGFFKAGKTMKERQQQQQQQHERTGGANDGEASVTSTSGAIGNNAADALNYNAVDGVEHPQGDAISMHGSEGIIHHDGSGTNATGNSTALNNINASDDRDGNVHQRRSHQMRSSSVGSIEDLSNMLHHPAAIASRLYNAFSNNASNAVSNGSSYKGGQQEQGLPGSCCHENGSLPKRKHRSKRSHKTLSQHDMASNVVNEFNYVSISEEKKSAEPELDYGSALKDDGETSQAIAHPSRPTIENSEQKAMDEALSPETIAYAMEHPFSPNPYEHPSPSTLNEAVAAVTAADEAINLANATASFFSFNMRQKSMASAPQQPDSGNTPSGCVGAYAHAVKTAATELTRLVKSERKSNFDALSPAAQLELGVRFIDACTSDTKLHIVKDILKSHHSMDVDRFFIGPDDTETCALHAAAFNGAEKVLQFLCGGIDELDLDQDCGLCDVDIRDANGWTALHFAAGANSVTSVRVLAENGAKLTIEASNGYTPYHWAERLSNEEVHAELERLGADNRFVGRWMFGGRTTTAAGPAGEDRRTQFVSFLANRFFAFGS